MSDANETAKEEAIKIPDVLPVLPLKDLVIFPFIIVPLSVSREKSINAVDQALAENRVIMLTAQRDFQTEDPGEDDLYRVGTVAIIMRMLKLPDGSIRILVQGLSRARAAGRALPHPGAGLAARAHRLFPPAGAVLQGKERRNKGAGAEGARPRD